MTMNKEKESSLKTISLTVDCPYCKTGYSFKKRELLKKWIDDGRKDPLHAGCKQEAKRTKDSTFSY